MSIRVLVVDDSAFMRKILTDILTGDPDITVVGTARDGVEALEQFDILRPQVITLDVQMPRLDGLGVLRQVMERRPTPVVMVSSLTREGSEETVAALALGAVDFVFKPSGAISLNLGQQAVEIRTKVKAAAKSRPRAAAAAPVPLAPRAGSPGFHLVVIGCSTGGPRALSEVVPALPEEMGAAVLVIQHMPKGFTGPLAARLDQVSPRRVREAADGDLLRDGEVLIAPGGWHVLVTAEHRIRLDNSPPRHGVRPSVDPSLETAAQVYGSNLIGVILTGMGFDGVKGLERVKALGGRTIAESEETAVIYGMPRAVVEMGLADRVLPLPKVAAGIVSLLGGKGEVG